METYGVTCVAALATSVSLLDILFILVAVPESVSDKILKRNNSECIPCEVADPCASLRKLGNYNSKRNIAVLKKSGKP